MKADRETVVVMRAHVVIDAKPDTRTGLLPMVWHILELHARAQMNLGAIDFMKACAK